MNISYKPEVLVGGKWCSNSLRFATVEEALASAKELMDRWYSVDDARHNVSDGEVNYRFDFVSNSNVLL